MITDVHNLIEALKLKPSKIILVSNLYDWLLKSNWNCILSEELKKYILNGGIVERGVRMNKVSIGEYNTLVNKYNEVYKENKNLKENAENNDKVVDKVNWENMLLKKENKQLKDNWNKLKKYINEANEDLYWTNNYDDILYVMQ